MNSWLHNESKYSMCNLKTNTTVHTNANYTVASANYTSASANYTSASALD